MTASSIIAGMTTALILVLFPAQRAGAHACRMVSMLVGCIRYVDSADFDDGGALNEMIE